LVLSCPRLGELSGSSPQLLPLIQTRRLRFFGHVARMGDSRDQSRALHASIRGLPKDWRRRPGRPRHTWLGTLKADLQMLNHGLNSAWRHAQDRGRCKQLVETATLQSRGTPVMMMMMMMMISCFAYYCRLSAQKLTHPPSSGCSCWTKSPILHGVNPNKPFILEIIFDLFQHVITIPERHRRTDDSAWHNGVLRII